MKLSLFFTSTKALSVGCIIVIRTIFDKLRQKAVRGCAFSESDETVAVRVQSRGFKRLEAFVQLG